MVRSRKRKSNSKRGRITIAICLESCLVRVTGIVAGEDHRPVPDRKRVVLLRPGEDPHGGLTRPRWLLLAAVVATRGVRRGMAAVVVELVAASTPTVVTASGRVGAGLAVPLRHVLDGRVGGSAVHLLGTPAVVTGGGRLGEGLSVPGPAAVRDVLNGRVRRAAVLLLSATAVVGGGRRRLAVVVLAVRGEPTLLPLILLGAALLVVALVAEGELHGGSDQLSVHDDGVALLRFVAMGMGGSTTKLWGAPRRHVSIDPTASKEGNPLRAACEREDTWLACPRGTGNTNLVEQVEREEVGPVAVMGGS
ncbi:hypothetical protein BHM03_00030497 [Ensete ventricosum]|nr:hypothetical protein BHM03_00030497 [Ensete ventricosum]